MKVLLATGVYPPRLGGPSKQVYDLSVSLAKQNFDVAVLTFSDKTHVEKHDGVKIYFVKDRFLILKRLRRYLGVRKMLRLIDREFKPELIQANSARFLSYIVGDYAKKRKIPSIIKYAGDFVYENINKEALPVPDIEDVFRINFKSKMLTILEKNILAKFDYIWAQSEFQRSILEKHLKIPAKKILVLPNFINTAAYKKNSDDGATPSPIKVNSSRKIILSVSRFVPWKNIEAQVYVARLLKEKSRTPFFLYLLGGGNRALTERIKNLVKSNNLTNEVKLLSEVSPVEVAGYFKAADIYLSTSLYEPFGIVFVEAMAAGLPIVAVDTCSVPEIVHDSKFGFVIKRGGGYIERLSERLKILIENEDIFSFFSKNALEESEKYDLAKNLDKFKELYKKIKHGA